jgi:tetratricopeptide (TPR) repeat protein
LHAVFSRKGDRVVTSSAHNTARIWDAHTGAPIQHNGNPIILRHEGDVLMAAFGPEDRYLVTASRDGTAVVWDPETGELKLPLLHINLFDAWFGRSGDYVVTASRDGVVRIWDLRAGLTPGRGLRPRQLAAVLKHPGEVFQVSLHPDPNRQGNGRVAVLGYSRSASKQIVVQQYAFANDERGPDQITAEAQLLAHRRVGEDWRDLVAASDEEMAKNWQERKEEYRQSSPGRPEPRAHSLEANRAEAAALAALDAKAEAEATARAPSEAKAWADATARTALEANKAARQFQAAIWHLTQIIKNSQASQHQENFLARRAECYRHMGEHALPPGSSNDHYRRAEDDYKAALEIKERFDLLAGRARIRAKLQKWAEALSDYEKAIATSPENRQLLLDKAVAHEKRIGLIRLAEQPGGTRGFSLNAPPSWKKPDTSDLKAAVTLYRQIRTIDMLHHLEIDLEVLRDSAYLSTLSEKWDEAIKGYTEALEHSTEKYTPYLHKERAFAYQKWEKTADAADDYETAAKQFTALSQLDDATRAYTAAIGLLSSLNTSRETKDRLACGELFLKQRQMRSASEQFEKALDLARDESRQGLEKESEINPDASHAHKGLGDVARAELKWTNAADEYRKAIACAPLKEQAALWRDYADVCEKIVGPDSAANNVVEAYSRVLDLTPEGSLTAVVRANAYEGRARAYNRLERWKEAGKDFTMALKLHPTKSLEPHKRLLLAQAQAYRHVGDWESALAAYDWVMGRLPADKIPSFLFEGRAHVYASAGRWDKAIESYDKAIDSLPPESPQVRPLLKEQADAYGRDKRWDKAVAVYDKAIGRLPDNSLQFPNFSQDQAQYYGHAGRWDKAIQVYQNVLDRLAPGDWNMQFVLRKQAVAYGQLGAWNNAVAAYDEAIERLPANSPQLPLLRQDQARIYSRTGRLDKSVECYKKALELLSSSDYRFRGLLQDQALAYGQLGAWDKALVAYDEAIKSLPVNSPQLALLLQDQARVYGRAGRWGKAVEVCKQATQIDLRNSLHHRLLAQAQAELNRRDDAKATLLNAQQSFPFDPSIPSDLARLYLQAGDKDKYAEIRAEMLQRFGQTANAAYANTVAWTLVLLPSPAVDPSVAISLAEKKTLVFVPTNYNYLNTLGAAYYRAGEYEKAVQKLLEAGEQYQSAQLDQFRPVDREGRADDLLLLAMAYARLNKPDEAKKAYANAVKWLSNRTDLNDPNSSIWLRVEREVLRAEAEELIKP